MATFRKRGTSWQAQVKRKGHRFEVRSFGTKLEAEEWARGIEFEIDRGTFVSRREAEATSVAEALERYERDVLPRKKQPRQERSTIRTFMDHPISKLSMAQVRGKDVADFIAARSEKVGPQRIRLNLQLLSHLFTVARKEWGMESLSNPVQLATKPKPASPRARRLEAGEEEQLLAAARRQSQQLAVFIIVAVETAMRRAELAALTWDRVDFKKRTAHLPVTKNGTSRTVPLSRRAIRALRGLPRRTDGRLWSITFLDSWTQAFHKLCLELKIEGLTLHDLRHEGTSRLFEKGLAIQEVAAITGHRDWAMLKRYTHPRAEDLAKRLG